MKDKNLLFDLIALLDFGMLNILLATTILLLPALTIFLARKVKFFGYIGSVVLCYLAGFLLANFPGVADVNLLEAAQIPGLEPRTVSSEIRDIVLPLAIPLLVFSTDFVAWLRQAWSTVLSFLLAICSVLFFSILAFFIFKDIVPEAAYVSGMLIGVYTGGTPNMAIIGEALHAPDDVFYIMNTADVILGGLYFFFLVTYAHKVLRWFLKPFPEELRQTELDLNEKLGILSWGHAPAILKGLGLTIFCFALSLPLALLPGGFDFSKISVPLLFLALTALGIGFSFVPKIRTMPGTYETGEYLILIFCVALGSSIRMESLLHFEALTLMAYIAFVMVGSIGLHFFLGWLFKIDADTLLITNTAAIYGPPFVGPVAEAIKNRSIVVSGLTSGLVGYAIGSVLGFAVGEVLKSF